MVGTAMRTDPEGSLQFIAFRAEAEVGQLPLPVRPPLIPS